MSAMAAETRSRRIRRKYTDGFTQQAVRLVLDEEKSVGAVARELDLTASALADWVTRARGDRTKGRTGLTTAEREELARLRKENRILQEERDILGNHPARLPPHHLLDQKLSVRLRCDYPGGSGRLLFGDAVANP